MRDVPIPAVQLPPQSVRDTAGPAARILSGAGPALAGDRGAAADARHDVPPMVVTISLGSLAVPGDEHAFLADWLKPEVARYARYGATVRLVLTYDNARLARLRARGELRRSQPVKLIWRVQPDDRTSSHLEVSVDASMTVGRKSGRCRRQRRIFRGWGCHRPGPGTGWRLAGPVAAVSSVSDPGGTAQLHVALGSTVGLPGLPTCPQVAGASCCGRPRRNRSV